MREETAGSGQSLTQQRFASAMGKEHAGRPASSTEILRTTVLDLPELGEAGNAYVLTDGRKSPRGNIARPSFSYVYTDGRCPPLGGIG